MRMIRLLMLALLLPVFLVSAAETISLPEVLELSRQAVAEKYPDADSVLLHDVQSAVYQPDGLGTMTDDFYQKALNEAGRRSLRELKFYFNTTYEKFELPVVEVIRPDGSVVKVDTAVNGKVAISPGQMGANIYDPANKVMTVTIPELAIGDIVHVVSVEKSIKARIPGVWCGYFVLQADVPILKYVVRVDAPAEKPLKAIALKDEVPGTVTFSEKKEQKRILYSWVAENVPQVIPEPDMPPLYSSVQRLLVSTAANWREISIWYDRLCRPRLTVTPEIRAETEKLIRNARTPEEKIMALFQFVSQQIRYMGVTAEAEAPGYEPHDIALTFNQRYGVCRDKAALLAAMLREAGFKAYPVLFMSGEPKDDEVPNNYFNHAVTAVELEPGKYQLMDPTFETTTELFPSALSNMSYLVAKPEGETLLRSARIPAEANQMRIESEATVSPGGVLHGESTFRFEGINDQIYRDAFSRWSPDYRRQFFAASLKQAIPGAELDSLTVEPDNVRDMSRPLTAKLTFSMKNFLPEHAAEFLVQLPEFGTRIGAAGFVLGSVGLEKRRFKLEIFSTCAVDERFKLTLPPTCRIVAVPKPAEISATGVLSWNRRMTLSDNTLSEESRFSIDTVEVTPEAYLELKRALREIDVADRELPVAKLDYAGVPAEALAAAFPEADSVVLDYRDKITLLDETSWTREEKCVRRILNYAGVKSGSEIKIPYNPAWETVKIAAAVTLPDGTRRELQKGELNLMDQPWVSSAPRYPAGRILVASLPGVTPGAVVESVILREVRQQPFFAEAVSFAGPSPVVHRSCTIDAPASLELKVSPAPVGVTSQERRSGDRLLRTWSCSNVAQLPREPGMAPLWTFAPTIFISSGNYGVFAKELNRVLESKLEKAAPAVHELARKLDLLDDPAFGPDPSKFEARIQRIRDFVAHRIRAVGPELNALPLSALNDPGVTLESGYGNSADRALLIAALLKQAKIDYQFVAASDRGYVPSAVKLLSRYPQDIFSALLVYQPGLECYLNDSSEYARLGTVSHEEAIGLNLETGKLTAIRPKRQAESSVTVLYDLKLAADGQAEIRVTRKLFGREFEAARRQFAEMTPEAVRRHFEELAAGFSQQAKIVRTPKTDFNSYPGTVSFELSVPHYATASGKYLAFALPGFGELASRIITAGSERRTPFWRNSPGRIELEYRIEIPRNFEVVRDRPEAVELGSFGSALFYEYFEPGVDLLRLECGLTLPVEQVAPLDYGKLVNLQRELTKLSADRILLVPRSVVQK